MTDAYDSNAGAAPRRIPRKPVDEPVHEPVQRPGSLPVPYTITETTISQSYFLAGDDAPLPRTGLFAVVDGVLRLPANLMHEMRSSSGPHVRLLAVMLIAMALTGVVVGAFSGGYQYLAVPLKLALGMFACALICLPSLYIFACLSGGRHALRETAGALFAGVTLTSLLLAGFAPVSWIFSQATSSPELIGALHLFFLLVSVHFGLRLTRRALAHVGGRHVPALWLWSLVFVVVLLQMSTTLRPLVGPFEGLQIADKQFFLTHWLS
ncbi:MAG: hypothetical protein IT378_24175 [Sandaracinaceae bacterium]|nr:hypothetical protein [Sandaracinaceae bacterium]